MTEPVPEKKKRNDGPLAPCKNPACDKLCPRYNSGGYCSRPCAFACHGDWMKYGARNTSHPWKAGFADRQGSKSSE